MKKNKAFTLIELLVTILILGITVIIGIVSVNAIINNSKEKTNELNINNIVSSSKTYSLEFKNEDKYWFVDNSNDDMEYSCTTIGMLINKGLLKEKILDTIINNKVITKDTSVLIKRDRLTKVNNDIDIIFDSVSCKENASIKVNFNILSEMEENSWFKEDVKINIDIENDSQIDKNNITYFVKENDTKKDALINNISGEEGSNWDINVGNEGVNLDLCVTINTLKDKLVTYCLSETQDKYKMDKTKPNSPELTLDTLTNKYKINSSNAKDNVTSESNLRYYITYDETLNEKEHLLDSNTRINEKVVSTYVLDEAGNKSDVVTKILNISDAQNEDVQGIVKYNCSLDNKEYDSYDESSSACDVTKEGTVTSKTTYKCSLKNTEYDSNQTASNNCYEIRQGTTSNYYTCSSGRLSGTKCVDSYSVSGSVSTSCTCTGGSWKYGTKYPGTYTACRSGYSEGTANCSWGPCSGSCSSQGSSHTVSASCSKSCTMSTSASLKCSCSISGKSCSNCNSTIYGNVSSITRYYCSYVDISFSDNTNYSDVLNNCKKRYTGDVTRIDKFYCPLDEKDYTTEGNAKSACTNYCSSGTYYDNGCYSFN